MTIKEISVQLALGTLPKNIRKRVAKNTNTPIDMLEVLSKDEFWYVRYYVAGNTNTHIKILTMLSKDKDSGVRYTAKQQWSVRNSIIEKLSP